VGDHQGVREEGSPFTAGKIDAVKHEASVSLNRIVPLIKGMGTRRSRTLERVRKTLCYDGHVTATSWIEDCVQRFTAHAGDSRTPVRFAFLGEGYRNVWANLRFRRIPTSKAKVLQLMFEVDCWSRTSRCPSRPEES
jgi:hypothetical protein